MTTYPWRLAGLLCPLLLVGACGSSGQQGTARILNDRLQARLAPDIAAGRAALQSLPDGGRVTLLEPVLFSNTPDALDNRQVDVRENVIEGLLDPTLMRIQVADTSTLPDRQRSLRVQNVSQFLTAYGLGPSLQPAEPLQAPVEGVPAGVVLTIGVQCPDYRDGSRYDSGRRPECN